jgi:predicted nucleotidyltransferase component of viral defense system
MALMGFDSRYSEQLGLVLRILPEIAQNGTFALKGGTAINLFEYGLPRLSVDIDLCYPKFGERDEALAEIFKALEAIKLSLSRKLLGARITQDNRYKLLCRLSQATVKIEVNTTMRGHVFPLRAMSIHPQAEELLEQYVEMPVISREELYGGKICAALDRQHPRDLFDLHLLLSEEWLSKPILSGFIVCLISHNRPLHELLAPNKLDMRHAFDSQFTGMSNVPFTYENYCDTRERLLSLIPDSLSNDERDFLLSFKTGEPDWQLLGIDGISKLPAVTWKLQNIRNLKGISPQKHEQQMKLLAGILYGFH